MDVRSGCTGLVPAAAVRFGVSVALAVAWVALVPAVGSAQLSLSDRVTADSCCSCAAWRFSASTPCSPPSTAIFPTRALPGDDRALAQLLRFQGVALAMSGNGRTAAAPLEEAHSLALAQRDTAQALLALRWRTYVAGMLGDYVRQEALSAELLALARAARDARYQSVALNFSGWLAMRRGDYPRARSQLEQAVVIQRRHQLEDDEVIALTSLGSVLMYTGEMDMARGVFARQLEIAQRRNLPWSVAQAFNGLGSLEMAAGDPALAADYFGRARALHCGAGETYDCAISIFNLVNTAVGIGHPEQAIALAREGGAMAERRGYARLRPAFALQVARAEFQPGPA